MGNIPYIPYHTGESKINFALFFLLILMGQTDRCVILFMKNLYSSLFSQASGGLLILSCMSAKKDYALKGLGHFYNEK